MSTQEEKKVVDETLDTTSEEATDTVENTETSASESAPEEPLSEVDQLKLQLAEAQEKNAELQD